MDDTNLGELLVEMAGGIDEYTLIREYIKNSGNSPTKGFTAVEYWNNALEGTYQSILVAFGRIIRQYENENKLEFRKLNDIKTEHIVDHGRSLIAIYRDPPESTEDGETLTDFIYTIGNYLQQIAVPEILSFWPYAQTTSLLLNKVSEGLLNESVKPLHSGETRIIYGFLGLCGEMPIALRLLNNIERKESYEKWTCQLPENVDVLILVIPDSMGYFPWQEPCSQDVRVLFPDSIKIPESQYTFAEIKPTEDSLPCLPGEFIIGAIHLSYLLQSDEMKELESDATIKFLREIRLYLEFEVSDDFEYDLLELGDFRYYEWNSFRMFSVPSNAARWLDEHLDDFGDDELAQDFGIGNKTSCKYRDKDAFIADVDFAKIRQMLVDIYRECVSSPQPEGKLSLLKLLNNRSEGEVPSIYKYISRY